MGSALGLPVRGRVVARLIGLAAGPAAAVCGVLAVVGVATGDNGFALRTGLVAGVFGLLALLVRMRPNAEAVQRNEAIVATVTMFVAIPAALAWPLADGRPWLDGFFEAVSAITTTGLGVLDVATASPAVRFARCLLQGFGGLGIVVLSLAVIVPPGAAAATFDDANLTRDALGTTRGLARRIVLLHGALAAAGVVALLAAGTTVLQAFAYPFAALSTGGFSPDPAGLGALSPIAQSIVTILCVAGAIPALLLAGRLRSGERRVALAQCAVFAVFTALAAVAIVARLGEGAAPVRDGILLAISAQTTTGFATLDVPTLDAGTKLVLVLAMFIGGPTGSTAGGIKVLRVLIAFRIARLAVERTALPRHAVQELRIARQRFDDGTVRRVLLIAVLFFATVAASWLPFVLAGHEPLDAMFEVVSATATVGLSTGITSAALPAGLKLVLCTDMLLGRLEFLALIVMLYPGTWFGRRAGERPTPIEE